MRVVLAGSEYELHPTFKALLGLEESTGIGLLTLAKKFADGSFTLSDAVAVLRAGAEGAGQVLPPDIGERLVTHGLAGLAQPLAAFLLAALSGEDTQGKASAANASSGPSSSASPRTS